VTYLVREIVAAASESPTRILNVFHRYYNYDKATSKWARKIDNCKILLGRLPRPMLIEILKDLK